MSDAGGAPLSNGADAPTELSESQAAAAIEGLLDPRPRRAQQTPPPGSPAAPESEPEQAPDAGPEEEPAPSDDEDDQTTEPVSGDEDAETDHQRVEPPTSWSLDDKAVFQQLPPEAQAVIARRESERDKAFHQKTEEIAEHRRAIQATIGEIQQERQSYAQNLQQLLFVAAPEAQKFADINWQQLASEQPAEYVRLSAERDALRGRVAGIQAEIQRVTQQAQQQQLYHWHEVRQAEQARLIEAMPEFGHAEKGPRLAGDMRQWLQKHGFSEQEIGQVIDHRVILVAHKAMLADRAAEARRAAETKRTSPPAAPVQPPGAPRQRSDSAAAQRRQQKMATLRRTGSEKDAVSLLMDLL
jgi:hypothetical protein